MEKTLFIVKPEGFSRREEIKNFISSSEFTISQTFVKRLTYDDLLLFRKLDHLYLIDEGLFKAYVYFMSLGESELGIIEGIDSAERFKAICGTHPNPLMCKEGTLRKTFGLNEPGFYQGRKFFLNAVHKSNNRDDAMIEVEIFKNLCRC